MAPNPNSSKTLRSSSSDDIAAISYQIASVPSLLMCEREYFHSPIFLLSNICNLVSVRLDSTNYILWRYQVESILEALHLYGYVDGSLVCPEQFLVEDEILLNPKFQLWKAEDRALKTLLNATLSQSALAFVVGCTSSRQVWESLERRYSSRTNIIILKSELFKVAKKSTETIDDYVQRIKAIRDKLAALSVFIEDEDVLIYTMNGLPSEYNAFRTSLRTLLKTVSLEELHVLLKAEESALQSQNQSSDSSIQSQEAAAVASNRKTEDRKRKRAEGKEKNVVFGMGGIGKTTLVHENSTSRVVFGNIKF